jgi:hypothetical protein
MNEDKLDVFRTYIGAIETSRIVGVIFMVLFFISIALCWLTIAYEVDIFFLTLALGFGVMAILAFMRFRSFETYLVLEELRCDIRRKR